MIRTALRLLDDAGLDGLTLRRRPWEDGLTDAARRYGIASQAMTTVVVITYRTSGRRL